MKIKLSVELMTQQEIMNNPKEKQGTTAIAFSLPEEMQNVVCRMQYCSIHEKVFDELNITELQAEEGSETLVPCSDDKF